MHLEIEENPNCKESPLQVFPEAGPQREIDEVRLVENGKEKIFSICGVEPPGIFIPAIAIKIEDSGSGIAHLIAGGRWGLRLKSVENKSSPWNIADRTQRGEPYLILASDEDILYKESSAQYNESG